MPRWLRRRAFPDVPMVTLRLWRSDAIVLFDWLNTTDMDSVPISHRAEKQALTDLLNAMERDVFHDVTQIEIDEAREQVARDMGW